MKSREIDREWDSWKSLLYIPTERSSCFFHNIVIQLYNLSCFFIKRNKHIGGKDSTTGTNPANQCFCTGNLCTVQRNFWLIKDLKFSIIYGRSHVSDDLIFQLLLLSELLIEETDMAGAVFLDLFAGIVGCINGNRCTYTGGINSINTCSYLQVDPGKHGFYQVGKAVVNFFSNGSTFFKLGMRCKKDKLIGNYPSKKTVYFRRHSFQEITGKFFQYLISGSISIFLIKVFKTTEITVHHNV